MMSILASFISLATFLLSTKRLKFLFLLDSSFRALKFVFPLVVMTAVFNPFKSSFSEILALSPEISVPPRMIA